MTDFINPAEKASKVFNAHINAIAEAVLFNNSTIPVTEENKSIVEALQNADLGYFNTDKNSLNLRNFVVEFVKHFKNKRNTVTAQQIDSLIHQIQAVTADYATTKINSPECADYLKNDASDLIVELANAIWESTANFADQCLEFLSLFNNLDEKIKRAQKNIETAKLLVSAIDVLSTNRMWELAVGDSDLEAVVAKRLMPNVYQATSEMRNSLKRLNDKLFEWKKDKIAQQKNNMIDAFHRYLTSSFKLNLDIDILNAPKFFHRLPCKDLTARADVRNYVQEKILVALTESANAKRKAKVEEAQEIEYEAVEHAVEILEREPDQIEIAIGFFFEAFQIDQDKVLTASETFEILEPGCDYDFWLSSLTTAYRNDHQSYLDIEFDEEQDPRFTGNSRVYDLQISVKESKKNKKASAACV